MQNTHGPFVFPKTIAIFFRETQNDITECQRADKTTDSCLSRTNTTLTMFFSVTKDHRPDYAAQGAAVVITDTHRQTPSQSRRGQELQMCAIQFGETDKEIDPARRRR